MKSKSAALLLLVLVASLWSASGILVKVIDCSPMALASARGFLAAITISILHPDGFSLKGLTKYHWLTGSCLAILSITFISAMKLTAAANVIVLQYTAPIWVAIIAPLFLRERTSGRDFLFLTIIFGGVVLFFLDGLSTEGVLGNILGLISGFFFGIQAMLLRSIKDNSPAKAMILGNYLTFLVGLPFLVFARPSAVGVLAIVAMGVFQMGLPYFFYTMAVPKVTSMDLVLVTMLEPVLCPIWVYLGTGERPGKFAVFGAITVIVAVTIWSVLKAVNERRLATGHIERKVKGRP
ncbi:MAG: DMT family transporter [Deltaproteobacteria bacterium]|jgi:drug/metabolite transporter (DMT)-like permease|nr:DMT family transporter [Deltaproteobacteria bacterium]